MRHPSPDRGTCRPPTATPRAAPWLFALATALAVFTHATSSRASEREGPQESHAGGEEHHGERDHGGELKEHTENLLGAKAIALFLFAPTPAPEGEGEGEHAEDAGGYEFHPRFGASVFYERELLQNRLEFEIQIGLVGGGGMYIMPTDILLKKPFHVNHRVTPYIGAGPALEAVFADGEQEVVVGLTSAVGVYVWFSKYAGIDVELDYTLVFSEHGLEHAPCIGVGPVFHF